MGTTARPPAPKSRARRAEAAARHAENAATAAEIAERATRGEARGGDPYACPVRVPSSMRYWTKPVVEQPGDAPAYDVEAYLTFVPDFRWIEQRSTQPRERPVARAGVGPYPGATAGPALLPPKRVQGRLRGSLADFFPALLENQDRAKVVTSAAFFLEILPRLAKSGRPGCVEINQRRRVDGVEVDATPPHRLPEDAWPPDAKVLRAARRCAPMHVAKASCYALYDWLDRHFHKLTPQTETTVVLFGERRAGRWTRRRSTRASRRCATTRRNGDWKALRGCGATPSTAMTILGDRTNAVVAHVRSAGWRTHGADWRHIDSAGRLLVPFYTYVYFVDHAQQNLHKRLIRDLVRHGDRVTCAAAAVVAWLDRQSTPAVKAPTWRTVASTSG